MSPFPRDVPLPHVTAAVEAVLGAADDPRIVSAIERVTGNLGIGLASLVNLTDADRIVLGGTLGRLYRRRPGIVRDRIAHRSFLPGAGEIPVSEGQLADSVLLGAAELALQPLLDDPKRVCPHQ